MDLATYKDDVTRDIAKALLAAGDDFRFDMSDQAPAAFGGTQGVGRVEGPAGLPEEPVGRRGRPAGKLEADAAKAYKELTARGCRRRRRRRAARRAAGALRRKTRKSVTGTRPWVAVLFLLPALVLLGALVVYPIGYSVWRSLYDAGGSGFVGLDNYIDIFTRPTPPSPRSGTPRSGWSSPRRCVTGLGLIFAVLTERVRWGTAFKLIIFMPMAISMLAAGIIFRLVYEQDPDQGVANAIVRRRARHVRRLLRLSEGAARTAR